MKLALALLPRKSERLSEAPERSKSSSIELGLDWSMSLGGVRTGESAKSSPNKFDIDSSSLTVRFSL